MGLPERSEGKPVEHLILDTNETGELTMREHAPQGFEPTVVSRLMRPAQAGPTCHKSRYDQTKTPAIPQVGTAGINSAPLHTRGSMVRVHPRPPLFPTRLRLLHSRGRRVESLVVRPETTSGSAVRPAATPAVPRPRLPPTHGASRRPLRGGLQSPAVS